MDPRRFVVTGANRGIGLELVRALLAEGHTVWGTARQADPGALRALGPAGTVQLELADETSIAAAAATLAGELGHIDVLINCAGVNALAAGAAPADRGVLDVSAEAFEYVQRVNVIGPLLLTRALVPLLRSGTDPLVVNVSSQLGSMEFAANSGSDLAYNVSKAALNMVSVRSAAELRADGISVVMIHPGWVSSDMGGASAPLTPVESAEAMVATISALGPDDTGRFLRWDGTTHPW